MHAVHLRHLAQDKQIDEDELRFQEAVHFSEPTAEPLVVEGIDILDEDDRTPGLDPDRMGAQLHTDMHAETSLPLFSHKAAQQDPGPLHTLKCKLELPTRRNHGHAWPVVAAI